MNEEYLAKAREKVQSMSPDKDFDVRLFINGVCKRAAQLAKGQRRLVQTSPEDKSTNLEIALREVAEGKVIIKPGDEE